MKNIVKKITSRKFIITAVIIIAGIGAALKSANNEKVQIAGYVIAGIAAVAYMVIEGTVDKAAVESTTTEVIQNVENLSRKQTIGFCNNESEDK